MDDRRGVAGGGEKEEDSQEDWAAGRGAGLGNSESLQGLGRPRIVSGGK